MILQFTIPGLPKTTNSSLTSWRAKMAEARKWKNLVTLAAREKRWQGPALEKANLTLIRHSSNCPDFDGLVSSFKHPIDGLIQAGVLVNDKMENIGAPIYKWEKASPGKGSITIIVEVA